MRLKLTPEIVAAAYAYLTECEPFSKWNLPPAEDLTFRVSSSLKDFGFCVYPRIKSERPTIIISKKLIGSTQLLMQILAHEMVHLYMFHHGITDRGTHGPAFRKIAKRVCAIHGFDENFF